MSRGDRHGPESAIGLPESVVGIGGMREGDPIRLLPLLNKATGLIVLTVLVVACASAKHLPGREGWDIGGDGVFPYTDSLIPPRQLDRQEAARELEREYLRSGLAQRGIQGRVLVDHMINEDGRVVETTVATSSGNEELDSAALRVGMTYRFRPAIQKGEPVITHIYMWINFAVRDGQPARW